MNSQVMPHAPASGFVNTQPGYNPATGIPMNAMGQPMYTVQPGMVVQGQVVVPMPPQLEGVPPGLEYLTMVDSIMVHQLYEIVELLTGWETKNKYALRNVNGEQVYYAAEESECCERQCCGPQRGFTMHIVDNFRREVIRLVRPFKCCGGGCGGCLAGSPCCQQECRIESPPGNLIGHVVQRTSCCSSCFFIKDGSGQDIFKIDGPCCCLLLGCQDKEFPITLLSGDPVGSITKKWGGFCREALTDADVFSVTFPMDLDVKLKAVLIGATFLIDFMEFEQPQNKNN